MKKILLSIFSVGLMGGLYAQQLVGTEQTNRVAVIEDYTGIYCGWCPDGAKKADNLKAQNPGKVLAMGVHSGGYANPSQGYPHIDFRTQYGTYLNQQAQVPFYPAGSVNRIGTAGDRNNWASQCAAIITQTSPVNIGAEAYYNPGSDEITVKVEAYYTSSVGASHWIHVAVLQDNVEGYQSGASSLYPERVQPNGLYKHMDNLRDYITGYFGEEITTTNATDLVKKTYTWKHDSAPKDISQNYLVTPENEDMKFVIFMTDGGSYSEIVSAVEVHAQERPVGINEATSLEGLNIYPNPFETEATIEFNLNESQNIAVNVFDVTGKVVQSFPNTVYSMGNHKLNVDGTALQNGLYYVNIVAEDGIITRKLILDK